MGRCSSPSACNLGIADDVGADPTYEDHVSVGLIEYDDIVPLSVES
jgi:hypothetical protein